jgi:hypothetical protein
MDTDPSWGMDSSILPPPCDTIEHGERIFAFWQAYNLDRCWSVVLQKPLVIPDGRSASNSINVPWPQSIAEYEMGSIDESSGYQTIRSFLEGTMAGGFSTHALRAKASALFQLADQFSTGWDSRTLFFLNLHAHFS